jgi:hypothetical protein
MQDFYQIHKLCPVAQIGLDQTQKDFALFQCFYRWGEKTASIIFAQLAILVPAPLLKNIAFCCKQFYEAVTALILFFLSIWLP